MKPVFACRSLVFVLATLGGLSACRSDPNAPSVDAPAEAIVHAEDEWIALGDTVIVSSPGRPELDLRATVSIDGTVFVPDIGPTMIAGLTAAEIEMLLLEKLGPYYDQLRLHVSVVLNADRKYFVFADGVDGQVFEAITAPPPKQK